MRRAGFWARCAAAVVDLIILGIPLCCFVSFMSVGMGISNQFVDLRPGIEPHEVLRRFGPMLIWWSLGFFVVMSWIYFAGCESASWQATPGKRLVGIRVVNEFSGRPTFWRASRRFFGGRMLVHVPYVGIYYFVADCLCVGVLPAKRAIHDWLSGCLVVWKEV